MAYKVEKKDPDFLSNFAMELEGLRAQKLTCDTIIKAGKSQKVILGHKIILAAGSKYFFNYFYGGLSTNISEISVEDIEYEILNEIIKYFYSSKIQITDENVRDILIAADFLQLKWLTKTCFEVIAGHLSKEDVFDDWKLFGSIGKDESTQEIISFVIKNIAVLSDDPQFLSLAWDKMKSILLSKMDRNEYQVMFESFLKWVNFNKTERSEFFFDFIPKIEFSKFDREFLTNCVTNESIVNENLIALKTFTNAMVNANTRTELAARLKEVERDQQLSENEDCLFHLSATKEYLSRQSSFFLSYNLRTYSEIPRVIQHWEEPFGSLARQNGHIYKAGGWNKEKNCGTRSFSSYKIEYRGDSCTLASTLKEYKSPALVACDQKLYIVDDQAFNCYDLQENRWRILPYRFAEKSSSLSPCSVSSRGYCIYGSDSGIFRIDVRDCRVDFLTKMLRRSIESLVCFGDNSIYVAEPHSNIITHYDVRRMNMNEYFSRGLNLTIPSLSLKSPKIAKFKKTIYVFDLTKSGIVVVSHRLGQDNWEVGKESTGEYLDLSIA